MRQSTFHTTHRNYWHQRGQRLCFASHPLNRHVRCYILRSCLCKTQVTTPHTSKSSREVTSIAVYLGFSAFRNIFLFFMSWSRLSVNSSPIRATTILLLAAVIALSMTIMSSL